MLRIAIARADLGRSVEMAVLPVREMRFRYMQPDNAQSLHLTNYQAKQTISALVLRAGLNLWHKAQVSLLCATLPVYAGYLNMLEPSPHFEDTGNLTQKSKASASTRQESLFFIPTKPIYENQRPFWGKVMDQDCLTLPSMLFYLGVPVVVSIVATAAYC